MLLAIFFTLLAHCLCDDFNRALLFPKKASKDNYVILNPDFSEVDSEFSVCAWLKISVDSSHSWFSYATEVTSNHILINVNGGVCVGECFGVTYPFTTVKNDWYHHCLTWESGALEVYMNGVRIRSLESTSTVTMVTGGTLTLGQDQDTIGGGFDINQLFNGEMFNVNVFSKKLSHGDVAGMFYDGRCGKLARSLTYEIVLSWEDIIKAERHGAVSTVDAGCKRCTEE